MIVHADFTCIRLPPGNVGSTIRIRNKSALKTVDHETGGIDYLSDVLMLLFLNWQTIVALPLSAGAQI